MQFHRFPSALLVAPLLVGLHPIAQDLAFRPREDSKLAKRFTIKAELEIGAATMEIAGQEMTVPLPEELGLGFDVALEVLDHYVDMEGEKPLELHREFTRFQGAYHAMEERDSIDEDQDGQRLRFLWNDEAQRYDVTALSTETEPNPQLAVFGIDMDYRSLLPGKSVSKDDAWKIDQERLVAALVPGIDFDGLSAIELEPEDAAGLEFVTKSMLPELAKLGAKLETTCTLGEPREVDGRELAAVLLRVELDAKTDIAEFLRTAIREGGGPGDESFELEDAELVARIRGKGELLWDVPAGHAHSFELDAKLEFVLQVNGTGDLDGQVARFHVECELLGDSRWTMTKP